MATKFVNNAGPTIVDIVQWRKPPINILINHFTKLTNSEPSGSAVAGLEKSFKNLYCGSGGRFKV